MRACEWQELTLTESAARTDGRFLFFFYTVLLPAADDTERICACRIALDVDCGRAHMAQVVQP